MSGRRETLLLCTFCLYMCSFAPFCVASMPWTCSLQYAPVEKIPLPTQQDLLSKESLDGGRRLRLRNAAIVLHRRGYTERETRADSLDDGVNRTSIENTIEGRECTCTGMLPTTATFYCPTPTDHCSVWVRSYSNEYGVRCFKLPDWKVGVARQVWYYLCFALLLLVMYPFFSKQGHVSMHYYHINFHIRSN